VIEQVLRALRAGEPVVLPFDTVYGLAADPQNEEAVRRLYDLKGRADVKASAVVAGDLDHLFNCIPELRRLDAMLGRVLPGPLTLIVANPAGRYPWLTGSNPSAIGIRVPLLEGDTAAVLEQLGVVVATSANHPGGTDPRRLEDVPRDVREGAGAVLDGGELPGSPSTVIDLTGPEPRILREGALPGEEALRRLGAAVRSG
jgi:L-threonylcarbamoyladenylate synthase